MNNTEFLSAIFGKETPFVHVTDFIEDPNQIPIDRHLLAWKGNYFSKYNFKDISNQYFTISIFSPDNEGNARRRKSLFTRTHIIVLDDVREKLSLDKVGLLPLPSYIMETSPGSEQWGYILTTPCDNRNHVENLLDGLITNGLAPNGKDPGMKGATRYVRLPDGYNTKQSKMIDGISFKCRLLEWNPLFTVTMSELAAPFDVDLFAARRDTRTDGAANVPGHPLLDTNVIIKAIRSDGRFDITCPWVKEHTGSVDNGAAFFTNQDGTIGFKCHHGACEQRTAKDLLVYLEEESPGFDARYKDWHIRHTFSELIKPDFLNPQTPSFIDQIRKSIPGSPESIVMVSEFLKSIDALPEIEKHYHHAEICDILGWNKTEFSKILKNMRESWYKKEVSFYTRFIFIREQNQFYDFTSRIFFTPEAFQNSFSDEDANAKKEALCGGRVEKVDKMDFAPKLSRIFTKDGIVYGNGWSAIRENLGIEGDCTPWLNHFDELGWGENKRHILQFMAFTVLYPERKINHILLLGGMEGIGKDFLLKPLMTAMGEYGHNIEGVELLSGFNDYLLSKKYLHINETELGDHKEASQVSTRLKPLAAAPPDMLRVNPKNLKPLSVRNIVNITMTTNSQTPIKLHGPSRRFYALWSDLHIRDNSGEVADKWHHYWREIWKWVEEGGIDHCVWYLRNCVDLSDFEPGAPPKTTEFLRSIQEASKSPMQQTIEEFIDKKIGVFHSDLITAYDACATLRAGIIGSEKFMYTTPQWFTPTKVGCVMRDIPSCVKVRARVGSEEVRPWIIRNNDLYQNMQPGELYDEYLRQTKGIVNISVNFR